MTKADLIERAASALCGERRAAESHGHTDGGPWTVVACSRCRSMVKAVYPHLLLAWWDGMDLETMMNRVTTVVEDFTRPPGVK